MANLLTKLNSVNVKKFRGLEDINIDFGDKITIICGKNGTSKSTILGVVAQIFSFSTDISKNPPVRLRDFKTLTNTPFKSPFGDHFRLSDKFDKPGTMDIEIDLFDGAFAKNLNKLTLGLYDSSDRTKPRPIVRGNDALPGANESRNVTHPVIYLSLQRLLPITQRTAYAERDVQYIIDHSKEIKALNNKLLIKNITSKVTATTGTIESLVVHGEEYDHQSVSVGEDNVGQILQAIYSFKRLKEQYPDYHGGILLIDEADAGLFPAAQVQMMQILAKASKDYGLQIIMTSHSPIMIEEVFNMNKKSDKDFKTIYLTDTYGAIQVKNNFSWPEISADLMVDTIKINDETSLPKVNIYFEDREAYDLYKQIITARNINKITTPLKEINISCSTVLDLMARRIPEFTSKSIIVLDGDVLNDNSDNAKKAKKDKNLCLLPTILPPDQLIFEFLYNLDAGDSYWENTVGFNKAVFTKIGGDIINKLQLEGATINIKEAISGYKVGQPAKSIKGEIRKLFKEFAHHPDFLKTLKPPVKNNPYRYWVLANADLANTFRSNLKKSLLFSLINGNGVDSATAHGYLKDN